MNVSGKKKKDLSMERKACPQIKSNLYISPHSDLAEALENMILKRNFLNKEEPVFIQASLRAAAGSHLFPSTHGNLLSLTFIADRAEGLSTWTGRTA